MNDLEKYFENNENRLINKFPHYFTIYDRHFSKYRGQEVTVLEIGVFQGGSLQMWKDYFGPNSRIIGIDINPDCKAFEEDQIDIYIGSQTDRNFLQDLKNQLPPFDIIIDDGGHTMRQQIISFEELYPHVKKNGVYLCEDLHTSYFLEYGGGNKRKGTFIEFSKNLIDSLNAFYSEQKSLQVDEFTTCTQSIHYYTSVIVIEKGDNPKPKSKKTGYPGLPGSETPVKSAKRSWKYYVLKVVNLILRKFRLPGFRWR